jgi:hypothetical protein
MHQNSKSIVVWFMVYGVLRHFQQYVSYIVAVSFIDGLNRITRSKPPTCFTYFIFCIK